MDIFKKMQAVAESVLSDAVLIGIYAILDIVLPQAASVVTTAVPGFAQFTGPVVNSVSFITKQVLFHLFGAAQIRTFLNVAAIAA